MFDVRIRRWLKKESGGYSTLSLPVSEDKVILEPIPEPITSFGATLIDQSVYTFGGHTGGAHAYSADEQNKKLSRLDLKTGKWEVLGEGPALQGLALITQGTKLYRIGGFTAKNAPGEDNDLWSQNSVACFDLETRKWTELPELPEPRSSHDAALVGNSIYVVGGWKLAGHEPNHWHKTAWVLDLKAEPLAWKSIPEFPYERRALSLAAHEGRLYVIGGMQKEGGPTTRVAIFNPADQTWSDGPALDGKGMTGFGNSSFATGGRLYVSTFDGKLHRLSNDGRSWEILRDLPTARFFHRMLPVTENQLLILGGANMESGKFKELDLITVQ